MSISAVGTMENSLANMATGMVAGNIQQKFGFAILKEILNSQEMQAQALLKMMRAGPTPTVDGTGKIVNIGA